MQNRRKSPRCLTSLIICVLLAAILMPIAVRAWENSRTNNRCGLSIVQYLSSNYHMVLCTPPNLPTRIDQIPSTNQCSTIDLTFATPDFAHLTQISLGPTTWDSDHVPIRISLNMKMDFISDLPSTWKFDPNKWLGWNNLIESNLTNSNISSLSDPVVAYQTWYDSIMNASNVTFKFSPRNNQAREPSRPWWSADIKKSIAVARRVKLRWLKSR